ncbi:MAG TPA: hypothetical protein VN229_19450 [Terriglobales bacterium]|nr:hypothetical protein [Terriglobales bacterium]
MGQRIPRTTSQRASTASLNRAPSTSEFSEYAAAILDELSKSATSHGLPVLAHLTDLAALEARFHAKGKAEQS